MKAKNAIALSLISSIGLLATPTNGDNRPSDPGQDRPAFAIDNEYYTVGDLKRALPQHFYEWSQSLYDSYEERVEAKYLHRYWQLVAKANQLGVLEARDKYLAGQIALPDMELERAILQMTGQSLREAPPEVVAKTKEGLITHKIKKIEQDIIASAQATGEIRYQIGPPEEPRRRIPPLASDIILYRPGSNHTEPVECATNCPIEVVEYTDPVCRHSKQMRTTRLRLLGQYAGKIKWSLRFLPENPLQRANFVASACALRQDKFWNFHTEIIKSTDMSADANEAIAGELGLDVEQWRTCAQREQQWSTAASELMRSAVVLRVQGTPTFFVNGKRIEGAAAAQVFRQVMDQDLAAVPGHVARGIDPSLNRAM